MGRSVVVVTSYFRFWTGIALLLAGVGVHLYDAWPDIGTGSFAGWVASTAMVIAGLLVIISSRGKLESSEAASLEARDSR